MALTQKKKKRQRDKRLNVLKKKEARVPQFFSPQRVLAAKAYQEGKEKAIKKEKRQKTIQKKEAATKREGLQTKKKERKI
jgi:hypothetical protein